MSDIHFTPIPITPELLVKCGGIKTGSDYFWRKGDIGLLYLKLMSEQQEDDSFQLHYFVNQSADKLTPTVGSNFKHAKIQYLHQLQSIYRCFVGEELNIVTPSC